MNKISQMNKLQAFSPLELSNQSKQNELLSQKTTKFIQLIVPISYQVPPAFQAESEQDAERISEALDIADYALQQLRTKTNQIQNETLYKELQMKASADFEKRIEVMKQKSDELHVQTSVDFEKRIKIMKQQADELEATRNAMKTQITELQEVIAHIRQEERERTKEIISDKDAQIHELRQQIRDSSTKLVDSFQNFKLELTRQNAQYMSANVNNSSLKGKAAELILAELLTSAYGCVPNGEEFSVNITAKESCSADIHMKWMKSNILWESKNYKEQVNAKEIQKFKRDFDLNKEMTLGVMVSFHSGIVGHSKSGNIDLEYTPDGRMLIYVSNFAEEGTDPLQTLQSLRPFLEVFIENEVKRQKYAAELQLKNSINKIENDNYSQKELEQMKRRHARFEAILASCVMRSNTRIKKLSEARNNYNMWQKKNAHMFADMSSTLREIEQDIKTGLVELTEMQHYLLNDDLDYEEKTTLRDNDTTDISVNNVGILLDTLVFTKSHLDEYGLPEQKLIKDILSIIEVREDCKVSAKEFKERLKGLGYGALQLSSIGRSSIFQPGIWDTGAKNIMNVRFHIPK